MRARAVAVALAACCVAAASPAHAAQQPAYCAQISQALPGVAVSDCQAQLLAPGGGRSVKGVPLLVRRIPAQAGVKGKPVRILLLGGIHGDEPTSSIMSYFQMTLAPPLPSPLVSRQTSSQRLVT